MRIFLNLLSLNIIIVLRCIFNVFNAFETIRIAVGSVAVCLYVVSIKLEGNSVFKLKMSVKKNL